MPLRQAYRDMLVGILDRMLEREAAAFDAARDAIAGALVARRVIHVAGSGHSHLIAEEAFYRAGGLANVQALLDEDLMLHKGAARSTRLEREPGRAAVLVARSGLQTGDVVIVVSNSGRNAFPVELAEAAKAEGATVIALTSIAHSRASPSRHASGRRLFEIADIALDNGGIPGDAALDVPGVSHRMGPTSTVVGVFLLNAVLAEAAAEAAAQGATVDVFPSANVDAAGGAETTEAILARWQPRIAGL